MASWASVTDQSNTDCSSHRSSAASDSDASFLTEADFASAVAKAAELSGLTVVGTTVCDPKTGRPGQLFKIDFVDFNFQEPTFFYQYARPIMEPNGHGLKY